MGAKGSLFSLLGLVCMGLCLAGCATIAKDKSELHFAKAPKDLEVYEGGSRLSFAGRTRKTADASFETLSRYILLDAREPHTLTIVSEEKEATVSTGTHVGGKWIVGNLFFAGIPGFAIDAATGKWKEFDEVDTLQALSTARSSLITALERNHVEKAKQILERSPTAIKRRDDDGKTALHVAVKTGNPELVHFLLQYNPDVNARDDSGQTPMQMAVKLGNGNQGGYQKILQLLQASGAK